MNTLAVGQKALFLDRNSALPVYFQIAQHLEQAIGSGDLAEGTVLESQCSLAQRLRVSVPTVHAALEYRRKHGLVVRGPRGLMRVVGPSPSSHRDQ